MRCPRCDDAMEVTHTYKVEDTVSTQRQQCGRCLCVAVVVVRAEILKIDPGYGEGASAAAKALKKTPPDGRR